MRIFSKSWSQLKPKNQASGGYSVKNTIEACVPTIMDKIFEANSSFHVK